MEAFESWEEPLRLIETDEHGTLSINHDTASRLQKILQLVIVVAIAGTYRQGKSYLMNRLAGRRHGHGFELGNTVEAKTKGIWIWCCVHPLYSDKVLVLIDTEGLGDPNKLSSERHDMMIFSLAVLLSSTFIFNTIGKIDQDMIQKLHFVTQITENIKVKSKMHDEEEYSEFVKYFPDFVLAVRDFTLELKIEDPITKVIKEVTADQYFNMVLTLKPGRTKQALNYNLPREAIRNAFRSHRCFVFTRPVQDEALFPHLEKLCEDELDSKFLEQARQFCSFIFNNGSVKKLQKGQDANGRLLLALAKQYVDSINSGAVPCIESTLEYVTRSENERVSEEAIQKYTNVMNDLSYPVSEQIFNEGHARANELAMNHFRRFSILDAEEEFFSTLRTMLMQKYSSYIEENENKSKNFCQCYLQELFSEHLENAILNGEFATVGGYKRYEELMTMMIMKYEEHTKQQIKAEEVKQECLKRFENQRMLILAADNSMTEKEKECENNRKETEALRLEKMLIEEEANLERERLFQLQNEHEMEMKKMQEEFVQREEKQTKEMDALIVSRLAEQEQLLKEGFDKRADELKEEISQLQKAKNQKSWFSGLLDIGEKLANIIGSAVAVRYLWKGAGKLPTGKLL